MADAANHVRPHAKLVGMEGDVHGRPARYFAGGQEVPEDFAEADDGWAAHRS